MKTLRTGLVAATASLALVLTGCGGGGGGERKTEDGLKVVTVAYTPIYSVGALKLGMDQGFFEKQGLRIELKQVANPPSGIAAVAGDEVDFNYTPSIPFVNAIANGVQLEIVGAADGYDEGTKAAVEADPSLALQHDDSGVVAAADSGITRAKDLEGKTVSVPARGAQLEVTIAAAVKADGGDPAKINWITLDFPSAVSSLKSGRVDAAGLVVPFLSQAEDGGGKLVLSPGLEFFDDGAVGMWVTSASLAKQDPEIVKSFQAAVEQTNEYAEAHITEAQQAAADVLKTDLATVQAGSEPAFPATVDPADVQSVIERMKELGYLKKDIDATSLVFGS
ncbi:ABC transporter substrate-binding protein [Nocardioides sp. QY071]|uniref:ABC transporter substrate-binding protein n=1 Tax=Nocardioides sp. QY071 TaxID=3044187 RepID=UPI00249A8DD6|nr:ABC transporter substrate-binding protein [Nocardioides sp. QY071]WGY00306.1 ABC transporter substrate-binding protein [Nocardioides sp. QY071]